MKSGELEVFGWDLCSAVDQEKNYFDIFNRRPPKSVYYLIIRVSRSCAGAWYRIRQYDNVSVIINMDTRQYQCHNNGQLNTI